MLANQKMNTPSGEQVCLFPLEYINISQAYYGTYSHDETEYYATDFLGWGASGRVYHCPCYAPVDMELIFLSISESMGVWQSKTKVYFADGTTDYLGIIVYHDNRYQNGQMEIGMTASQGDIFNYTGTGGNVTGDHMHLECGKGKWNNPHTSTPRGTAEYKFHFTDYTTVKRIHVFNALYANDTIIVQNDPRNIYDWKYYSGGVTPTSSDKIHKFPWYIIKRKRDRLNLTKRRI